MTTFSTWTHPATNIVRVYISGFGQTKVWAEACAVDKFGFDYTIKAQNPNRNRSELGGCISAAEANIFTTAGSRIKNFADVLALSK